jgi:hypothetical protein
MRLEFQKRFVIAVCLALLLLSCSKQSSKALPEKEKDTPIAKLDKFVVTGLIKNGDSPIAGITLMLVKARRQGKDLNYRVSTDENGYVLNSEVQSDDHGKFSVIVNPLLVKDGQEYIIVAHHPRPQHYPAQALYFDAVLGNNNSILLFKIEGEPREINQGELNILGARELKILGVKNLNLL